MNTKAFSEFEEHFKLRSASPSAPYRSFVATDEDLFLLPWVQQGTNGQTIIHPQVLSQYLKQRKTLLNVSCGENGQPELYLYEQGVYRLLSYVAAVDFIKKFLPPTFRRTSHWQAVYNELTTDYPDLHDHDLNANRDVVNFQNGLLHLPSSELRPHSPDVLSTMQIACDYIPEKADPAYAPVFMSFLRRLVNEDAELVSLMLEIIGLIIGNIPAYLYKRMLILYGKGNTGKTVMRELVMRIIGKENCHSIDLKTLNGRFGVSQIYGKRLIGSGDMSFSAISEIDKVKELTGGDDLNAERKGKDGFSFRFPGFVWMNANALPKFGGDQGTHVYERLLVVPCLNVVSAEERNPNLSELLFAERESIVALALRYLKNTITIDPASGKKQYLFTEGEVIQNQRIEYARDNSSLMTFVSEYCEVDEKARMRCSEFNLAYQRFCQDQRLKAEKTKNISDIMLDGLGIERIRSNGNNCYPLRIRQDPNDQLLGLRRLLPPYPFDV